MNISITNDCNRRCHYCFQREWYLSAKTKTNELTQQMSVQEFKDIIDWMRPFIKKHQEVKGNSYSVKVMGGEPLMHPDVFPMYDYLQKSQARAVLLTNLSVENAIIRELCGFYSEKLCEDKGVDFQKSAALVNTDYPDNQEKVFLENIETVMSGRYDYCFAYSATLLPDNREHGKVLKRLSEVIDRHNFFYQGQHHQFNLRLSPYTPNPALDAGKNQQVADFSEMTLSLIRKVLAWTGGDCIIGFDCAINACEFNPKTIDAFRDLGVKFRIHNCGPDKGFPCDILVDGSAIWCSSGNCIRLNNWRDYKTMRDLRHALADQYHQHIAAHPLNEQCKNCELLHTKYCEGLCFAKNLFWLADNKTAPVRFIGKAS